TLLLGYLQEQHCLIVLDNVETILQEGERVGHYQKGHEGYGRLLQRLGETQHMSCLLLTSREKPKEIALLEGKTSPVRSLPLHGVDVHGGKNILRDKELFGTDEEWKELVKVYAGNPLALKLVSESVTGIFGGNIARFLAEGEAAFGSIYELLAQQFTRLSPQEQEILYWLAIERVVVSLEAVRENIVHGASNSALFASFAALQRRSIIEKQEEAQGSTQFTLQPVIMEYVTKRLLQQAYTQFGSIGESLWTQYALIKAYAKDYVRERQIRVILAPLAEELESNLGKQALIHALNEMLIQQRATYAHQRNYLAGNILNLMAYLRYDLRGADFSNLSIRQAYLQNVPLPYVNFAHAHFISSVFTNTFGNILSVAFSPQGKLLAAGTAATGEIWLYDAIEGIPLRVCHGHTDSVWSVVFSADEQRLISSSDDQTIRIWDVQSGRQLQTLQGHTNRVRTLALSADGTVLASGSDDQTVRLWDMASNQCFRIIEGHIHPIWAVALSRDGKIVASGSNNGAEGRIQLWDVQTGALLRALAEPIGGVRSLAFNTDGTLLVSGSNDQIVRLWDVEHGQCLKLCTGHTSRVWSVAFSPDGKIFASGSEDNTVRLWETTSGMCLSILQHHTSGVRSVAFNPSGNMLATGGEDQTVRLWDVNMRYCLKTLQGHTNRLWSAVFSPDGKTIASCHESKVIRLWDVKTRLCSATLEERAHGVRAIAYSSDGRLVSGEEDQTVRVWDTQT
ncbi:MAG: WD40 repeat domain-containing protein, partial [Chloroflexota bacterium]|nr:WD40 repeat domain-containing protein [Chloroflexota bacterium]